MLNGHIETIYPALFRPTPGIELTRERISTPDQDFLDLDWAKTGSSNLVLICHGLEGNSRRGYMLGMARAAQELLQWDALCWNYRGCSGEINHQHRFYHSGATDDLDTVIGHCAAQGYTSIVLIGFSLGGNLVLKYMGEHHETSNDQIKGAIAFSVPLDLESGSRHMMKWTNYGYTHRFLRSLKAKVLEKEGVLPEGMTEREVRRIRHLFHFDDIFTGPLHGFKDAKDYYRQCSSLFYLKDIGRPTLIVNAKNDPFLSPECYPTPEQASDHVRLEFPEHGGHCGFGGTEKFFWSEKRAMQFIQDHISRPQ